MRRNRQDATEPFAQLRFPDKGRRINVVSNDTANADWKHYTTWYAELRRSLARHQWKVDPHSDGTCPECHARALGTRPST